MMNLFLLVEKPYENMYVYDSLHNDLFRYGWMSSGASVEYKSSIKVTLLMIEVFTFNSPLKSLKINKGYTSTSSNIMKL